jgi:hypothetical protein
MVSSFYTVSHFSDFLYRKFSVWGHKNMLYIFASLLNKNSQNGQFVCEVFLFYLYNIKCDPYNTAN